MAEVTTSSAFSIERAIFSLKHCFPRTLAISSISSGDIHFPYTSIEIVPSYFAVVVSVYPFTVCLLKENDFNENIGGRLSINFLKFCAGSEVKSVPKKYPNDGIFLYLSLNW